MDMDKYLYFRGVADEDNDDGDGASSSVNPTSIAIPARMITGIAPASDATVIIYYKAIKSQPGFAGGTGTEVIQDSVTIGVNTHRHQNVINAIIAAINNDAHNNGFIDVCDDVTTLYGDSTTTAVRLHGDITGVADTGISVLAAVN